MRPLGMGGDLGGSVVYYRFPVVLRVGVLAARQLQEGGKTVQVGHLVEGAQQQVHHHQAQEQVGCWGGGQGGGKRVNDRVTGGGCVIVPTMVAIHLLSWNENQNIDLIFKCNHGGLNQKVEDFFFVIIRFRYKETNSSSFCILKGPPYKTNLYS